MRKISLLLFLSVIFADLALAQEIKVESFELDVTDLEAKLNPVHDAEGTAAALVRIRTVEKDLSIEGPLVGSPEYDGEFWHVYLKQGAKSLTFKARHVPSFTYKFREEIVQSYVYGMSLVVDRPQEWEYYLLPFASWHPSQQSFGMMVGAMKGYGWYVSARSDFNPEPETSIRCDGSGRYSDGSKGWFTGESKQSRLSVSVGGTCHIRGSFYAYAGAGYGRRTLAWQLFKDGYAEVSDGSAEGLVLDGGFLFRKNRILFMAGLTETQLKWLEGCVGVGIVF